ncbi:MAG: hypothetical protein M1838_002210 [Thelocarpon superellum]|nr:MAG: hypothetical protein M1838_002210 [Thelocarpon superellum]
MSEEDLRRLMLSYDTPPPPQASTGVFPGSAGGTAPMPGQAPRPPGAGDPMMQLMQQMMGGEGAGGADGGLGGSGAPPGLAEFLAQAGGGVSQAQSGPDNSYVWRIIHAVCALTLGLVAITSIHFSGSLSQRNAPTITYTPSLVSPTSPLAILNTLASSIATNPFLGFTTMELVLQSARFFIEKSRLLPSTASPPSAMLNTVLPLIPPPYRAWVEVASRYAVIYSTVMADAMLLVFVLGVGAWWNASRW